MRTQNHRAALGVCVVALLGLLLWVPMGAPAPARSARTIEPQGSPAATGAGPITAPVLREPEAAPRTANVDRAASNPPPPIQAETAPDGAARRIAVIDAHGAPVPFAPGWVRQADGNATSWTADARGEASLMGRERGTIRVGLGAPTDPWPGAASLDPAAEPSAGFTLVAPATGAVEVRVVDEAGSPVPQAAVATDDGLVARTDWDGRCAFPCLRAGQRRLHASAEGLGRGNHAWRLAPGARDSVAVVLAAR